MIERHMASPIPMPPFLVVKKLPNRRSRFSGEMPGPPGPAGADNQSSRPAARHCLHGIDRKIDKDLLDLNAVGEHLGQFRSQLKLRLYIVA